MTDFTVTIIVCTYRRPNLLRQLLDSLRVQEVQGVQGKICIVDNDAMQSARAVVAAMADGYPWPLHYHVQPVKNIARTRNLGLAQVDTDYVAFIDDDEVATPQWLASLLQTARTGSAELVFGPVVPVYPQGMAPWLIAGGFYERPRHVSGSEVPLLEARTGNVLIKASVLGQGALCFDEALGLSGGEDYAFFQQLYCEGVTALWSDEAVVTEEVPLERAEPRWLLKRSFRIGSVEACLVRRSGRVGQVARVLLKACYLAGKNAVLLLPYPCRSKQYNFRLLRNLAISCGIFYGLVNGPYREYQ